jgi:hypothetical protein
MTMNVRVNPIQAASFAVSVVAMMAACAPEDDRGPAAGPEAALRGSAESISTTSACEQLRRLSLPGVAVSDAVALEVSERLAGAPALQTVTLDVPHCRVQGVIDSTINFELLLPDDWNGKFLMGGGGGFVGSVQNQAQDGLSAGPTPLERGYATAGTDTGHAGEGTDASWALNDAQAKENFAHRAVHRTAEVSKSIIADYYQDDIDHSYFFGCSRGGGQAMLSAQRYPEDFDGIIAGAPALDWPGLAAAMIQNQQVIFPEPSDLASPVVTADNRKLLADSIRSRCDTLDGVADGVVNDPRQCPFEPADLPRCESAPGSDCVTEAQAAAIETVYRGAIAGRERIHPGFPFGGEADPQGWDLWITKAEPPLLPPGIPNLHYAFGTEFAKYFVYSDSAWTYADFSFSDWPRQTAPVAELLNATDPDLSGFRDRGGKLILWHGWSDAALTALDSIEYYESAEQVDPSVRDYFRMFLMPGVAHCAGGPGPDRADWISALEQWVEHDVAPERVIASKADGQGNATTRRPLCPYPQAATYDGSGDVGSAESFVCSAAPTE